MVLASRRKMRPGAEAEVGIGAARRQIRPDWGRRKRGMEVVVDAIVAVSAFACRVRARLGRDPHGVDGARRMTDNYNW